MYFSINSIFNSVYEIEKFIKSPLYNLIYSALTFANFTYNIKSYIDIESKRLHILLSNICKIHKKKIDLFIVYFKKYLNNTSFKYNILEQLQQLFNTKKANERYDIFYIFDTESIPFENTRVKYINIPISQFLNYDFKYNIKWTENILSISNIYKDFYSFYLQLLVPFNIYKLYNNYLHLYEHILCRVTLTTYNDVLNMNGSTSIIGTMDINHGNKNKEALINDLLCVIKLMYKCRYIDINFDEELKKLLTVEMGRHINELYTDYINPLFNTNSEYLNLNIDLKKFALITNFPFKLIILGNIDPEPIFKTIETYEKQYPLRTNLKIESIKVPCLSINSILQFDYSNIIKIAKNRQELLNLIKHLNLIINGNYYFINNLNHNTNNIITYKNLQRIMTLFYLSKSKQEFLNLLNLNI